MSVILLVVLFVLGLEGCVPAAAYRPHDTSVQRIVDGVGKTRNEALEDAILTAIKLENGVFTSSDMVLENGELIKNQLHSLSAGHVTEAKILSTRKSVEGDVEVTALVHVNRGDLRQRVRLLEGRTGRVKQSSLVVLKTHRGTDQQFASLVKKQIFGPLEKEPSSWIVSLKGLEVSPGGSHLIVEYTMELSPTYLAKVREFLYAFSETGGDTRPAVRIGNDTVYMSERRRALLHRTYVKYAPIGRRVWLNLRYDGGRQFADGGNAKPLGLMNIYLRPNVVDINYEQSGRVFRSGVRNKDVRFYFPGDECENGACGSADYRFLHVYYDVFRPFCFGCMIRKKISVLFIRDTKEIVRQHIKISQSDLSGLSKADLMFDAYGGSERRRVKDRSASRID